MSINIELSAASLIKPEDKNFYDHEAKPQDVIESHLKVKERCLVVLTDSLKIKSLPLKTLEKESAVLPKTELLFELHPHSNHFQVKPVTGQDPNSFYQLIKANDGGVALANGNVIKLGKVQMKVVELHKNLARQSQELQEHYNSLSTSFHSRSTYKLVESELFSSQTRESFLEQYPCCRVCLSYSQNKANKILNCCSCKGSSQYIHEQCLATWIHSKIKITSRDESSYSFKRKHCRCEICLSYFKFDVLLKIMLGQEKMDAYCVLETEDIEEMLTFLNFSKKQTFFLGRGSNVDFAINDITVSRNHCVITYDSMDGAFNIVDLESKFGTLLRFDEKKITKSITLQVGRTIVDLQGIKKQGFLSKIFKFCATEQNLSKERIKNK